MNRELKKTFFLCLLAVLLIVSNLVGAKLTNLLDVTVGVDFVTYPFTFLCTLLILNTGDKKDAYRGILVASIIQLLITICYVMVTSLGSQTLMPDKAMYVDMVFKVNETNILVSVLAFIVSHCTLIYLYDSFKEIGKELYGLTIGLLGAMIVNSIIYLVITLADYDAIFIINMMLGNVIISVIMVVIITILFYILREKKTRIVPIKEMTMDSGKDKGVEEVVKEKNVGEKKTRTATKTTPKKKGNKSSAIQHKTISGTKTGQKKSSISKTKVKKEKSS